MKRIIKLLLGVMFILVLSNTNMKAYAAEEVKVDSMKIIFGYEDGYIIRYKVEYTGNASYYKFYVNDTDATYSSMRDGFRIAAIPGIEYNVKIIPYDEYGNAGQAKEMKFKTPSVKVTKVECKGMEVLNEKTNLYEPGIKIVVENDMYIDPDNMNMKVYRSTSKNSGYEMIEDVEWSNEYIDKDVKVGIRYYYKVVPYIQDGNYNEGNGYGEMSKAYSGKIEVPMVGCGGVQYNDSETPGKNAIVINIEGKSSLVSGVYVYRSTNEKTGFKKIGQTCNEKYVDKTVKYGKTYYYKLKAYYYDKETKKAYTGKFSLLIEKEASYGSRSLSVTRIAKDGVALEWEPMVGIKKYVLYVRENDLFCQEQCLGKINKKGDEVYGLKPNKEYVFRVLAYMDDKNYVEIGPRLYDMNGSYRLSNVEYLMRTTISIEKTSKGIKFKEKLTWKKPYRAKGYKIVARTDDKEVVLKTIKNPNKTQYTFTNSKISGMYKYDSITVYTINGSETSSGALINMGDLAIEGVKAKRLNATSAKISWKAIKGVTEYRVIRSGSNEMKEYVTTNTSIVDKNLSNGIEYEYQVYGLDEEGENCVEFKIAEYTHKLGKTKITSISNLTGNKVKLTWKKVKQADKYVVYRATSEKGKYKKIKTVKGTTFTDSGLEKGKKYYYKVVVQNVNNSGITVSSAKSTAKSIEIKK